jgi:hypothetical protein
MRNSYEKLRGSMDSVSHDFSYVKNAGAQQNFGEVSIVSDSKLVGSSILLPGATDPYDLLVDLAGPRQSSVNLQAPTRRGQLPPVEQSLTSASLLVYLDPQNRTPMSSPVKASSFQDDTSRPLSALREVPRRIELPNKGENADSESFEDSEVVVVRSRPVSRGAAKDLLRESVDSYESIEPTSASGAFVIHSNFSVIVFI